MPQLAKPLTVSEQISPDGTPITTEAPKQETPVVKPPEVPKVEVPPKPTEEPVKPTDEKLEETVDFTAFLDAKESSIDAAKRATKPIDKKPEEKPEVKVVPQPDSDGRDYSEFNDEEKGLFKRMSNDAFNKLKPVYLNSKKQDAQIAELRQQLDAAKKGQIPDSYYEHPQAFVLSPEFTEASTNVDRASLVLNHWTQQLEKVREGAKEVDILGIDQKGNFVISQKIPADTAAETKLISYLTFAQNQLITEQAKLQAIANGFKTKHQDATVSLRNFEKTSFPLFETDDGKKKFEPLIQDTINNLPQSFRSSPLASILAKSLVTNIQLGLMVQQLQKNGAAVKSNNPATKIGPSGAEAAGDGGDGTNVGKNAITIDDFDRVKQGLS